MSMFMPTRLPMTGRPAAMYWMSLKPHLPCSQGVSSSGMMPRWDWLSSLASVSLAQGMCTLCTPGHCRASAPMTRSSSG